MSTEDITKIDDLTFDKNLGSGFFGEVWRARRKHPKDKAQKEQIFAVKKVKLALIKENNLLDQLKREVDILYALKHPRVVRLHFNFDDGKYVYLGMEFAAGGTLFERLTVAGKFEPSDASRYFRESCEALDYLHHLPEKIIHRDIKPENILLDGEDHVKLADFGWANMIQAGKRDTFCGTLDYLPPEMIMGSGHDESVDMWNMGVLLYELTTGSSPFSSSSKEQTCRLILSVDLRFPPEVDDGAKDLIAKLCKRKPKERLTVRQALEHPFVRRFAPPPRTAEAAASASTSPSSPKKAAGGGGSSSSSSSSKKQQQEGQAAAGAITDSAALELARKADEEWSRPSIVARRLKEERGKICAEMALLVEAKRGTEEALMKLSEDLETQRAAIVKERQKRSEVEANCAELEKSVQARDADIEELKRKATLLQAEVTRLAARDKGAGLGWVSRRAAGRAATAAEAAAASAAAAAAAAGDPSSSAAAA